MLKKGKKSQVKKFNVPSEVLDELRSLVYMRQEESRRSRFIQDGYNIEIGKIEDKMFNNLGINKSEVEIDLSEFFSDGIIKTHPKPKGDGAVSEAGKEEERDAQPQEGQ